MAFPWLNKNVPCASRLEAMEILKPSPNRTRFELFADLNILPKNSFMTDACLLRQVQKARFLCSANANLVRGNQLVEVLRFVEYWHDLSDHVRIGSASIQAHQRSRTHVCQPTRHLLHHH